MVKLEHVCKLLFLFQGFSLFILCQNFMQEHTPILQLGKLVEVRTLSYNVHHEHEIITANQGGRRVRHIHMHSQELRMLAVHIYERPVCFENKLKWFVLSVRCFV